jgi:hypothetical protein
MPQGLQLADHLITYPKLPDEGESPATPASLRLSEQFSHFQLFFTGAPKKRARIPYIHTLFQILKISFP